MAFCRGSLSNSSDIEPLASIAGITASRIGVDTFFIISGFLITQSFINKKSFISFIKSRVLRIYPALIGSSLFCVCIVGWYFTTLTTLDYFSDPITRKFFIRNSTLYSGVKYHLPGVFESNSISAVNGSLWTLPYEVKLYFYLGILGLLFAYIKNKWQFDTQKTVVLLICIGLVITNIYTTLVTNNKSHFIHLSAMFSLGSLFFLFSNKIRLQLSMLILFMAVLIVSTHEFNLFFVFYSILLPYIVFFLAYIPRVFVRQYNHIGDYSYGMYIYAYPIQQSIVAFIPNISVHTLLLWSFCITLMFAVLSWNIIEKPALRLK